MTNPLPKLQQDAREAFRKRFARQAGWEESDSVFLDEITARVYAAALDSVERIVSEVHVSPPRSEDEEYIYKIKQGWIFEVRDTLLSHLRTLREGITGNEHVK